MLGISNQKELSQETSMGSGEESSDETSDSDDIPDNFVPYKESVFQEDKEILVKLFFQFFQFFFFQINKKKKKILAKKRD